MDNTQNPFGLHTITPYLMVKDATYLIDFLTKVFGAQLRGDIHYRSDESVQHAELKIGDSHLMMGEPMTELPEVGLTKVGLYVYVEDCDSTYEKALKYGAESIMPPDNFPHGDRYGGVKDREGNSWWIVTHIGNTQKISES